jgi:large subunit ribosomal protein L25
MKEVALPAELREAGSKGVARRLRSAGGIPAVVYGLKTAPYAVQVKESALRTAMKEAAGSAVLYDLQVGDKANKVVIRDLQRDPLTSRITHIDFHAIAMDRPLRVRVPIHFVGTPVGVKVDAGIMQTTMREMSVSCLPKDMPEKIEINVEELGIGEAIHVRDIDLPNVELLDEPQRTIVVISAPTVTRAEADAMEAGEAVEGEAAEAETAEGEAAEGGDEENKEE